MTASVTISLPFLLALALFASIGFGYLAGLIIDLGPNRDVDRLWEDDDA
jgi:hypothetical protein